MGIDVCVVSYNTPTYLQRFLHSYSAIQERTSQLYLRVNGPTKADYDVIDEVSDIIDLCSFGTNVGYARAVNDLVKMGENEIVGIFNADVTLTPDLWDCVQYMEDHEDIGVLGPRQTNSYGRLMCAGGIVGTQKEPVFRAWNRRNSEQYADVLDVVGVIGSAYFIRRNVWEELTSCQEYAMFLAERGESVVGAFLPTKHWFEETFCTYHAREHGYRVVYYGPALLRHESGQSGKPPGGKKRVWEESKQMFRDACDAVHQMERE
jgi:GT2 family glycosyltransferase